jgi:Pvc16 N-terminal domain
VAAPDVIADASETLRAALDGRLAGPLRLADVLLHDLQAPALAGTPVVTISLWEIAEDPSVRNRPPTRVQLPGTDKWEIRAADLGLVQRYVIAAWAPATDAGVTARLRTEQQLLGIAAEFFHRNALLSGGMLAGQLAGTNQALGVTMAPPSIEDRVRLWHGLVNRAVPVALYYEVRVVNMPIDARVETAAVKERRIGPPSPEIRP